MWFSDLSSGLFFVPFLAKRIMTQVSSQSHRSRNPRRTNLGCLRAQLAQLAANLSRTTRRQHDDVHWNGDCVGLGSSTNGEWLDQLEPKWQPLAAISSRVRSIWHDELSGERSLNEPFTDLQESPRGHYDPKQRAVLDTVAYARAPPLTDQSTAEESLDLGVSPISFPLPK